MACWPSNIKNKKIKNDTISFLGLEGLHEDKLCETLQAMELTNVTTVHETFLLHIESNLDRLGLVSPIHGERSQQQSGQITLNQF